MNRWTFGDIHRRWAARILGVLALVALACCGGADVAPETTGAASAPITTVQSTNGGTGATSATFPAAQTAGNLNVVIVGWADATTVVNAVTDTRGNVYALAAPMTTIAGDPPLRQAIYYAKNIAAGANTVQVAFSGTPFFPDLRILEYAGMDRTSPFDVTASATGSATGGTTVSSGNVTTTAANELIVGAGMTTWIYGAAGASFTQRVITSDGNIAEDRTVSTPGTYAATAVLSGSTQNWIMQVVTFKGASTPAPTLSGVSPASGTTAGGTSTTLTGSNFVSGATVSFCGTAGTNVTFVSSMQLTAKTPAHAAATCDVKVTNPDAQSATLTAGFAYTGGACVPTTCSAQGKNCGTISNGCGGTLTCGSCSSPATCGGGGTPNVCGSSSSKTYTTDFNLTETPISEGGAWKHLGLDWTRVVTASGLAHGTQTGSGGFDDSYAYLSGTWPANQSASAVIHLEPGISATFAEVEILLRWTDSAHNSLGYECNLAHDGQYAEIIRWPGPLGTGLQQFHWVSQGNPVAAGVHDGDVFQCDIVGNVITSRLNGNVIATGTDNVITSGAPGMGFYSEGAPASQKYSFTQFSAKGL